MTDMLTAHLARLIEDAEEHLDQQEVGRKRALEYYDGVMHDLPAEDGRSKVVSRDLRAVVLKVLPSVMRTFFAGEKLVEFLPVGQEDEEAAQQATDYINGVVVKECGAETALKAAFSDAMLLKTGVLKWCAYQQRDVVIQSYTDQPDEAIVGIFDDPAVELLEHEETEETDPGVLAINPEARRHDFKIKRVKERVDVRLEAVPRGSFLIMPGAESIEASPLVGERQEITRSDLIARGYDRKKVYSLPKVDQRADDDDEEARLGDDYNESEVHVRKAMQRVEIYELYVRLDEDDDGIAELHKIVLANTGEDDEGRMGRVILEKEEVEEAPYSKVVCEEEAHQFEGRSVAEDVEEVQRIKSVLFRATLDNLYQQANLTPAVDFSALQDPDQFMDRQIGEPIMLKNGRSVNEAIQWQPVPMYAKDSFAMLGYMDELLQDRTGITDASGGLDPEGFVNMTATAANLINDAGVARADMMVRSLAKGVRRAFQGILRLVIAHADQPRTVRMRGQWVEYNPAAWSAEMDCTVNTGLGAGTRERDMQMLQIVKMLQTEIVTSLGVDNPFVGAEQLYNMLEKLTETAGFPSADPYFKRPDPQEIAAKMEAAKNAPDPEVQKMQAQLQLQMQVEQMKVQSSREKERAQMEADLQVKRAEIEARQIADETKWAIEREKLAQQERVALAQIEADMISKREAAQMNAAAPVPNILPGGLNG
jgi:hypothetical protein